MSYPSDTASGRAFTPPLFALGQGWRLGARLRSSHQRPQQRILMLDTTLVRAHQQAAIEKGGPKSGSGAFPMRIDH
jgi:hypothetical protein